MQDYEKEILRIRKVLHKNRKKFWEENRKNFDANIKNILDQLKLTINIDDKWKVYITSFNFISEKEIPPFHYDSFSSTNLIAASKNQGYEIAMFINKARLGFLSFPALIPLMIHEIKHVEQAAKHPKKYLMSMIKDKISEKLEHEADKDIAKVSDEFRKEEILESILYCYDQWGWTAAQEMADFWHSKIETIYGFGYLKDMTKEEYAAFLEAKSKKDINRFIDFFAL